MRFRELMWESRCQQHSELSSDSEGRMSDILHWTELRALINGPLVDRQFPPLQGVELRSWAECKRSFSARSSALSLNWPQRTAGRQPAVSTPRLAHNWANRDKHFSNKNFVQKIFRLVDLFNWNNNNVYNRDLVLKIINQYSDKFATPVCEPGVLELARLAVLSFPAQRLCGEQSHVTTGLAWPSLA